MQSVESYLDLTRLTLGLGNDWKIDKVLLDEQIQRIDIYISHFGGGLPTIYASQKRENLIDFKFLFDLRFT